MTTVTEVDVLVVEGEQPPAVWGWFLAAGIAWFVVGISILSWNPATIALISFAVGAVVILAGIAELAMVFTADGWKWLHALAGVFFVVAGILAFTRPFQTFAGLAMLFGWYLLVRGMVVLTISLATRGPGSLWGLGVAVGIINLLIGLWAIGYPGRSAWLLVLWIGIGAIAHGIADIFLAFAVRSDR